MRHPEISVLIVEDELPVRSLLTDILSPLFRCSSVESAGDAIRLMQSCFFHLALIDTGLPGMSGLGLCRVIINRSPTTVVVMVSGDAHDLSIAEAMRAGASAYITKPFDLAQVVETVRQSLGRHLPGAVA